VDQKLRETIREQEVPEFKITQSFDWTSPLVKKTVLPNPKTNESRGGPYFAFADVISTLEDVFWFQRVHAGETSKAYENGTK
jgi:hypothetical protein